MFELADFTNSGNTTILATDLKNGDYVVATTIDNYGNTSEFPPKISIGPEIAFSATALEFGEVSGMVTMT